MGEAGCARAETAPRQAARTGSMNSTPSAIPAVRGGNAGPPGSAGGIDAEPEFLGGVVNSRGGRRIGHSEALIPISPEDEIEVIAPGVRSNRTPLRDSHWVLLGANPTPRRARTTGQRRVIDRPVAKSPLTWVQSSARRGPGVPVARGMVVGSPRQREELDS